MLSEPQPDPAPPDPCKAVLDQQVIFGDDVTDFRAVSYGAPTDTGPGQIRGDAIVTQAIGRYPSAEAAQAAFDALAPAIQKCDDMHIKNYQYTVAQSDADTLTLHSNVADIVDHVSGATLIHTVALGLPETDRIAETVMQSITDRLA